MLRYGLIILSFAVLFTTPRAFPFPAVHKRPYKEDANFKNFKEGVDLFKSQRFNQALKRFKKSTNSDFALIDYSYLLMAEMHNKLGNPEKALAYLRKTVEQNQTSTKIYASKLRGEIYLTLGKYQESCLAYLDFFKSQRPDSKNVDEFKNLTLAYTSNQFSSNIDNRYLELFASFLKYNLKYPYHGDTIAFLDDAFFINGKNSLSTYIYENSGRLNYALKMLRGRLLWGNEHKARVLSQMVRLAQRLKNYPLKVKILGQLIELKKDKSDKANLELSIGLAYLNMDREKESLRHFKSAMNSERAYTTLKANYYAGRIYEFLGQLSSAVSYFRRAKKARFRNESSLDFYIKSIFRAGWINYKLGRYTQAKNDFEFLHKKLGNRLSEEGYVYWFAKTLMKLGKKNRAKELFSSFYSDFPVSYYGILCALELKKHFDLEITVPKFYARNFEDKISKHNERIIERTLLLFTAGLEDLARFEYKRIRLNYRNKRELHVNALLNMLLENHRKAISLADSLINRKLGFPSDEITKIYYPLKYMSFITNYSKANDIDPYMIISLIRQESVFHEEAISRARAMGLMQVIPPLGYRIAEDLELGHISERELLDPSVNLKIGIYHFGELMKKFDKNFIYAIAAYNSSEAKVGEWLTRFKHKNAFEFIEDIPYYETRKYVKMNVRNYLNYLRLYSDKDWLSVF